VKFASTPFDIYLVRIQITVTARTTKTAAQRAAPKKAAATRAAKKA
jgi:hypothetical protein